MVTLELWGRINEEGKLEVDLPDGLAAGDVKVVIEVPAAEEAVNSPLESLLGLCADLGPAPSAEDIDEVRREMMVNFPREDIA